MSLERNCNHPYNSVREIRVDVLYNNIPLNRVKADYCDECNTFLNTSSEDTGDKPTVIIGRGETGCNHPSASRIEEKVRVQKTVGGDNTVYAETTVTICDDCNHPPEQVEIELNDDDPVPSTSRSPF